MIPVHHSIRGVEELGLNQDHLSSKRHGEAPCTLQGWGEPDTQRTGWEGPCCVQRRKEGGGRNTNRQRLIVPTRKFRRIVHRSQVDIHKLLLDGLLPFYHFCRNTHAAPQHTIQVLQLWGRGNMQRRGTSDNLNAKVAEKAGWGRGEQQRSW